MHIVLTDILACPRCGPQFGLVLLADRVEDRRVDAGVLGCSNCREKYPIRSGVIDFGGSAEVVLPDAPVDERLAALLGVTHGPAFVLLAGPARAQAASLAALIDELEVVTIDGAGATTRPGVNPLLVEGSRLPIVSMKVSGVALTGTAADALLEEGARVTAATGRLVLEPAPADAAERLARSGLRVAAQQNDTVVAVRV